MSETGFGAGTRNSRRLRCDRGLSVLEYAVVILALTLALVAGYGYLRGAVSGKWKQGADAIGFGRQYDPATTTVTTPVPETATSSSATTP